MALERILEVTFSNGGGEGDEGGSARPWVSPEQQLGARGCG